MGCSHSNVFAGSAIPKNPQLQNVCGVPQFDVFGDSREFFNSDVVVPLIRMQAEGQSS
jgi:hypothetical protein